MMGGRAAFLMLKSLTPRDGAMEIARWRRKVMDTTEDLIQRGRGNGPVKPRQPPRLSRRRGRARRGANSVPGRQVAAGKDERKASMTSAVSAPSTTPTSPARGLVCRACGAEYPLVAQHACYECFGPLEVAYDQAALARVTRAQIEAGPQ